jgi:hypothetical protein
MAIPGFIREEIVLYKTSEQYKMAGAVEALAGSEEVMPQQTGIGCFNRTFSAGPFSLTLRCCALPPRCCLRACAFGLCRSFCIP